MDPVAVRLPGSAVFIGVNDESGHISLSHEWNMTVDECERTCVRCGIYQWRVISHYAWQGPFDRRGFLRTGMIECEEEVVRVVMEE